MINETLYNKTVDILVQAYLNDTLRHGYCYACAVGNIVANCIGDSVVMKASGLLGWEKGFPMWDDVFMTVDKEQAIIDSYYVGEARNQIDSTGYSVKELASIEYAFETAPRGESEETWMFNGLMAVVDALDKIHENTDTTTTTATKSRFALTPLTN